MADAVITPTSDEVIPHCPHCETVVMRRRRRQGAWEKIVLSALRLYPWECRLCRKTLFLRRRFPPYDSTKDTGGRGKPPFPVRPRSPFTRQTKHGRKIG